MRIERLGRSRWLAWDCRMRCAICAGLSVPISSARMQLQRGAARRGEDTVTSVLQEFQDSPERRAILQVFAWTSHTWSGGHTPPT